MKKTSKVIISVILVICILMTTAVTALAVDGEEYLCELRLIYAEDYSEALDILEDSEFYDYELLDQDLNQGTGEMGVWLAYKTTEDIEDAITDIAVIQMNGGYREGNYQEMIKKSSEEYYAMAQVYKEALDYWKKAYNAGDFLANAAYRQLNFYTIKDENSQYNGKLLGDVFLKKVDQRELATMFFEGNSYALGNIRSLISMGVAYDYDKKVYYLDKVAQEAVSFSRNSQWYSSSEEEFNELAVLVAPSIAIFGDMFSELAAYEAELDYTDDVYTELELKYMESAAIAEMMKKVDYLDGKTLYEFCLGFEYTDPDLVDDDAEERDYTDLYPLIGALNEGQLAMTKVCHYYDVVRYGLGIVPKDTMTDQIDELEKRYSEYPFDIYTGVDRSIYDGTFALTSAAYRAEAYTEGGLAEALFGEKAVETGLQIAAGGVGAVMLGTALVLTKKLAASQTASVATVADNVKNALDLATNNAINSVGSQSYFLTKVVEVNGVFTEQAQTYNDVVNSLLAKHYGTTPDSYLLTPFSDKYSELLTIRDTCIYGDGSTPLNAHDAMDIQAIDAQVLDAKMDVMQSSQDAAVGTTQQAAAGSSSMGTTLGIGFLYIAGGLLMLYSAISLGISVYNYYHPEYDDIPTEIVDLIDTVDGDRYIKYEAVLEAEAKPNGEYVPGDTNAFTGQRWNALYYTKSYEAGAPLLASFNIENDNSHPEDGYTPIHRFGEVLCFDLNKYHFDSGNDSIYVSVEQSENQKSAVADVPEVVGSMISDGWLLLAGGIGLAAGIGVTFGTQVLFKRKKSNKTTKEEA